jgi:hypothetical protein
MIVMNAVLFPNEYLPAASKEESSWSSTSTAGMLGDGGCQTGHGNWRKFKDLHPMSLKRFFTPFLLPLSFQTGRIECD